MTTRDRKLIICKLKIFFANLVNKWKFSSKQGTKVNKFSVTSADYAMVLRGVEGRAVLGRGSGSPSTADNFRTCRQFSREKF